MSGTFFKGRFVHGYFAIGILTVGGGQVLPALREHDLRPGAQGLQGHSGHPLRDTHTHTHTHTPAFLSVQCSGWAGFESRTSMLLRR